MADPGLQPEKAATGDGKDAINEKRQSQDISRHTSTSGSIKPADDVHIDTGVAAEDEKKEEEEGPTGMSAYLKLWSYAEPIDRVAHLIGFLAAIGAGSIEMLMVYAVMIGSPVYDTRLWHKVGDLVNTFNDWSAVDANGQRLMTPHQFRSEINKSTLYFVYLFIGKFTLVYLHTTFFTITATRMTRSLRLEYVRATLRQETAYFDKCSPGSVATAISTNANLIQTGLGEKVGLASQGLAMLIAAFVVAFTQSWKLTLVTITTMPAVVILVGITVTIDQKLEAKILEAQSKAGGLAEEVLGSVRNVVAFGAGTRLGNRYREYLDIVRDLGKRKGPVLGLQYSAEFSISYCAYALAFWYGIKLYMAGEVPDGGTVTTVFFSCIIATSSLTIIAPSLGDFTKAAAAAKDVHAMIARQPSIDSSSTEGLKPSAVTGHLEVKNISFTYPARPTVKVLDGISLVFEERKTTALVGASGSGKSTIIALLERWYDPESGSVFLDGNNIKDLNLKWTRSQIGLVQQEPVLFNDSIYANVARGLYGSEMNALPEDEKRQLVKDACIESNAHDFIMALPEGYDTPVGERAGLLSGGQKQRVAIARAIVSDPPILLLDEATSALDPKAEAVVQAALDNASRHRTTIMIAHRLSTVRKADRIVVMSKGRIVEQGTHESLLNAEGAYYRLVGAQNLSVASRDDDEEEVVGNVSGLERAETMKSRHSEKASEKGKKDDDDSKRLGLFKCLWIVILEHRHLWPWFLGGMMGSLIGGLVFPVQALLFSRIVTVFSYTGEKLKSEGNFWALMFFMLALATLFAYASMGFFWTTAAFIMGRTYRLAYFTSLISQDIVFYDQPENSSGALTSRLSSDPQHVHDLIQGNIGLIFLVCVNLIGSCIISIVVGWQLALVAIFGCLPFIFTAGFVRMRLELSHAERTSKFFLESARFAAEAVGAIRTVSSLTLEDAVYESYQQKLYGPVKKASRRVAGVMILFGLSESTDMLGNALAFWYGGKLISEDKMDVKQFFLVLVAVVFGGQAAGFLFGFTSNMTKSHMAANHIISLRASKPPINSSTGTPVGSGTPAIEFKDVIFTYPTRPDARVIRHLNLSIASGSSVALVGASGCGKSTTIALLERFYDPTSGTILINGTPLTSLDVQSWRSSVALVAQDPILYQGTIKDNIALGYASEETPSDAAIEAAARDANIHDFITSLPQGYETDLGSKGVALSGGQRQRLAIARALIRDPAVLLLDEATSALDTESEKIVQEAIEKASKGRTTVAVAHRLSTIRNVDCIFVFGAGSVVEQGTHEELLERRGVYWEMCKGQSLDREA
ncbi:P-loop containing nucleoside triphosphate hydrolase protein [Geopyxis carbonaria]|nr:P-loop containing nucleoside triphosphate hydrolase protein [Geopyxis carbonaria]